MGVLCLLEHTYGKFMDYLTIFIGQIVEKCPQKKIFYA